MIILLSCMCYYHSCVQYVKLIVLYWNFVFICVWTDICTVYVFYVSEINMYSYSLCSMCYGDHGLLQAVLGGQRSWRRRAAGRRPQGDNYRCCGQWWPRPEASRARRPSYWPSRAVNRPAHWSPAPVRYYRRPRWRGYHSRDWRTRRCMPASSPRPRGCGLSAWEVVRVRWSDRWRLCRTSEWCEPSASLIRRRWWHLVLWWRRRRQMAHQLLIRSKTETSQMSSFSISSILNVLIWHKFRCWWFKATVHLVCTVDENISVIAMRLGNVDSDQCW